MLRWIEFAQRHRKGLKLFDIFLAVLMIGYGIYAHSWGWWSSGLVVLLVSWFDPAARLNRHVRSRIVSRPKG